MGKRTADKKSGLKSTMFRKNGSVTKRPAGATAGGVVTSEQQERRNLRHDLYAGRMRTSGSSLLAESNHEKLRAKWKRYLFLQYNSKLHGGYVLVEQIEAMLRGASDSPFPRLLIPTETDVLKEWLKRTREHLKRKLGPLEDGVSVLSQQQAASHDSLRSSIVALTTTITLSPYMLGLKVKEKWLNKMRTLSAPKTEEVRRYTPEGVINDPKYGYPDFFPGLLNNRIFLLCGDEVFGSFRLGAIVHYGSKVAFDKAAEFHKITKNSAPGNGPESYGTFLKECFSKQGKGCWGWKMLDVKWFDPLDRPRSHKQDVKGEWQTAAKYTSYKGIPVPCFSGQQHGHVFAKNALFPATLDAHTRAL
eukprot:TRINITY_DN13556_c0_g2_i1.p1 TRINITY_DN13556_c0_g2~~TRINITY_DN13556_c0_g2_i1.p1  ORF type:complete len:361 (-),score=28.55 TRINITY_DN13556_c0_g2_i1:342-1424(-)